MEGEAEGGIRREDEDGEIDVVAGWRTGRTDIKCAINICG